MRIVIAGAGTVGKQLAARLVRENHEVIVVDTSAQKLRELEEFYDLQSVNGDATNVKLLQQLHLDETDLVVAVTNSDTTNVLFCTLVSRLGKARTIARIRRSGIFADEALLRPDHMGIEKVIYPEKEAASLLSNLLLRPYADQRFTFFPDDKLETLELVIHKDHPLVGAPIKELRSKAEDPFLIACVIRGDDAFVPVNMADELQEGDHIFITATPEQMVNVVSDLGWSVRRVEKIFIYGGSDVGMDVAHRLERMVRVNIIDPDRQRTKQMAYSLQHAIVLHGEGTDSSLLDGEGVRDADAFAAVTTDENSNLLSCLLAKKLGVRKTLSLVAKPDYVPLISELNVDTLVSQRLMTINKIMQFVRRGDIVGVSELVEEKVQALQFRVNSQTLVTDASLASAAFAEDFPSGAMVGGIYRKGEVIVPDGSSVLKDNDHVVVFTPSHLVPELESFFA